MKKIVLDHGVCATWFLRRRKSRRDIAAAGDIYNRVRRSRIKLIEPATWHADVAATLLRVHPKLALKMIEELITVDARIDDDFVVLQRAAKLSVQLDHRLSDTLYHAAAIENGITLISSNARYFRKARHLGHIVLLSDWPIDPSINDEEREYQMRVRKRPAHLRKNG
jgi:predicted nucleic acid-binding protein